MSSVDTSMLVEMGFSQEKIAKALAATGNSGVEAAMEWLIAHADELDEPSGGPDVIMEEPPPAKEEGTAEQGTAEEASTPGEEGAAASDSPQVAKSLKCDECGKLFKSQLEVEFHAGKTGHSSFSESTEEKKPLTEEEKQEQLRLVEEKLKLKRKEREEKEKQEALERERIRIKSGKEMVATKKRLEEEEMKKIVEARRRDKIEEQQARQRIKEKIEQDKIARRAKFGMATPEGATTSQAPATVVATPPAAAPTPTAAPKDYSQTKLNVRLTNGETLTQTFGAKEELNAVRLYVEINRTDGAGPFSLMTNFPRKVFTGEDYDKPLDALGLVPSAVIIVSRAAQ